MGSKYSCERCCDLGIVQASLVKEDNEKSISVLLCTHFDERTERSIAELEATGLVVSIAGKAEDLQPEEMFQ